MLQFDYKNKKKNDRPKVWFETVAIKVGHKFTITPPLENVNKRFSKCS